MNISFPDIHTLNPDTFGILFPADVDGHRIKCLVNIDALQDINPSNATDTAENQFSDNKHSFRSIAEEKIRNGEIVNGQIVIEGKDVGK